ncbi:MAG: sensor histidine kinase, partial [Patulibacter sp.]|nr:sensor histidine kinase [Patulibacter sp.]
PAAFARVVDNLGANAVAAGDARGVVRVQLEQDATRRLVLRVVDDGHGIPEGFLPKAFERFARADSSRRTAPSGNGTGSGLGLALVRGIAERAGGTASLRNGEERGAVATVVLPSTDAAPRRA